MKNIKTYQEIMDSMTKEEKKAFYKDCQQGFGDVCERMTCLECLEKKAYVGQEEKEQSPCTQD